VSTYLVKEIFGPTIQGEGAHAGTPCVFLRFATCNLACTWCDTDFAPEGAEKLSAQEIAQRLDDIDVTKTRLVIVTGGEPTLQWDQELRDATNQKGFRVHMESNGTRKLAATVDWLTVSPKPRFHEGRFSLVPELGRAVDECKVVVDETIEVRQLDELADRYRCQHLFLQPCDDERGRASLDQSLALLRERPRWRLSLQLHKLVGVP